MFIDPACDKQTHPSLQHVFVCAGGGEREGGAMDDVIIKVVNHPSAISHCQMRFGSCAFKLIR